MSLKIFLILHIHMIKTTYLLNLQYLGYLFIKHTIYTYSYDTISPIYRITAHSNSIMYVILYAVDMSNDLSLAMARLDLKM